MTGRARKQSTIRHWIGILLLTTVAGCTTSRSETQTAYDACTPVFNEKIKSLQREWAFVSGVTGENASCYSIVGRRTVEEAQNITLDACRKDFAGCYVYQTSAGPSDWVRKVIENGGTDPANNDDDDSMSIGDALGSMVRGFAGGVGAAAAVVGASRGDTNLSNQGMNLFSSAVGDSSTVNGTSGPIGGTTANENRANASQIGAACKSKALTRYSSSSQNVTLQAAACVSYCAYTATKYNKYFQMYQQNQNSANSLCSVSVSQSCNNIDKPACTF